MAAAVDRSRLDRLLNAEDPPDAAERGVTYEFLERLVRKQKLSSLSTRQVVKQYVVPQTFNSKCSLSGLLRQIHPQSVGRATHYVVHPWDGDFERLVNVLGAVDGSHDDEEGNPPYFWIDVFALNQRQQVEGYKREEDAWLHRDEMFSQLRHCMRTIDKIVVIVDPVPNPIVLKRAWCMFELAQAIHSKREIMLCAVPEPPDCDPFLDVVHDFENTMANYAVKFSKCEATIPVDKEWLEKEVQSLSALGEKWLDETVGQELLGWLGDRAAGRVLAANFLKTVVEDPIPGGEPVVHEELTPELVGKRILLMQSLSQLLASLDRAEKARDIIENAIEGANSLFGPEDERTLSMRHDLACLSAKHFGGLRKADQELRTILALRVRDHGENHPLVVESMEALAWVLKERRKLTEAISLFKSILAIREKTLGPTHPQTLMTLNILALTLQKREHYKEAERVFKRLIASGIDVLGATNLDVMVWSNNLAVLYLDTKQYEKAEVLLRTTLRNAEHSLGPTHPHTLTLVFNLGYCLWHQGRVRAAEGFFRRELAGCLATKGPDHRDTQRSRQNLARLITLQHGREKEAESILKGESVNKEDSSNASGSPPLPTETKTIKNEKRVAISNPEIQPITPNRHSHLVKAAAGMSALPPPRGVTGPRKTSAEWTDNASLPKELTGNAHYRFSANSPVSDGDDRTADDTTAEDRSQVRTDEEEANHRDMDEDEVEAERDESYDDEEYAQGSEGHTEDETVDEDEKIIDDIVGEVDEDDGYYDEEGNEVDTDGPRDVRYHDEEIPPHRRIASKDTMGTEFSEEEDVVAFEEDTIDDSVPRERFASHGRQRREQTVTSDDELLAENLVLSDEEGGHFIQSGDEDFDIDEKEDVIEGGEGERSVEDAKEADETKMTKA